MANAAADEAMDIFKPVLKMLSTILTYDGSLTANADDAYVLVLSLSNSCVDICPPPVRQSRVVCVFRQQYPCYISQQ